MAEFNVEFVASAAKEFRSLPANIEHRVRLAVDCPCDNPFPMGVRKLRGHKRLYRGRAGQYRLVYEVDEQRKWVLVTRIRHRREAYR